MNRVQKKEFVDSFKHTLQSTNTMIITHYHGLTVSQMTKLRSQIRSIGANYSIVKNKLAKIAFDENQAATLDSYFIGPTAVAFSNDPVSLAKVIVTFAKENEKMKIIGGVLDNKFISVNDVTVLSTMPSLDELRGKIVGLVNAPASKIVRVLQTPAGNVARVLSAYSEK